MYTAVCILIVDIKVYIKVLSLAVNCYRGDILAFRRSEIEILEYLIDLFGVQRNHCESAVHLSHYRLVESYEECEW